MKSIRLIVAALAALIICGTGMAFGAQDAPESATPSPLPDILPSPIPGAPNALNNGTTNLAAAEELPHADLGRSEAAELLCSVFGLKLEGAAGIFNDLEIEKLYSSNVAVISQPAGTNSETEGSESALIESSVPLGVEKDSGQLEPVDLGLERSNGELQPAEPLVDIGIPDQLEEGISLPGAGVEIELANAPEGRAASVVEENTAFFPNVETDTDLAVTSTPDGAETLTQLRSPAAPLTQRFNLSLPDGAILHATQAGGAEVSKDDTSRLVIPPPTALDAEGQDVPVSLEVSGSALIVRTNPQPDAKYPILVDPLYEQPYVWLWNHSFDGMYDWYKEKNSGANSVPYEFTLSKEGYVSGVGFFPGLTIQTGIGTAPQWSQAKWYYTVPRYWTDTGEKPTTFIRDFTLHRLWYSVTEGTRRPITVNPTFRFGLWNGASEQWTSEGHRYGTEGNLSDLDYVYHAPNLSEQPGAKIAVLMLDSGTETQLQYRNLLAGEASIELSDKDAPGISHTATPGGWVNNSPGAPLAVTASDSGLGVKEVVSKLPNSFQVAVQKGCTGIASNPCPRVWDSSKEGFPPLSYQPQLMPQGEDWVQVEAVDPIGHRSPEEGHGLSEVKIKVDHSAPSLSPSGTATEQASAPNASEYKLKYSATDGDGAGSVAGTPFGSAGTGPGQMGEPKGIAVDSSGNLWVVDRGNKRVMKYDSAGNFLMQFGSAGSGNGQFSDPRSIAISANGTVWVTDIGNNNVQAFNSSGQFLRKIAAEFTDPYGVASGPGGVVWVSDITTDQLSEFNENGTTIRTVAVAGGSEPKSPTGLATDAAGNVWLVDFVANRVQKYNSSGNFLMQFGSTGTGNGQLESPIAVALAPSGNLLVTDSKSNRVQVFQPNGTYLCQFGSTGSNAGQFSTPVGIATAAANTAFVVDSGNHRVVKWTHADLDRQSGVVSTEVKVDGNLVEPKYAPGCATENCSINNREWTLKANAYSSGQHNVKVIATDGVGLSTTKEFTVTTDATAPGLSANSAFFTAPEGWLEQKSYSYSAVALDMGGSGVISLKLKVDGKVVGSKEQTCPTKGCAASLAGTINMATYKGGAHPAELIATDVAGNIAKKVWTINVDPKGEVPVSEAINTLEAAEDTGVMSPVGPAEEEEGYEGTAPGLGIEKVSAGFNTVGTYVPATISSEPEEGLVMQVPEKGSFALSCATEAPLKPEEEVAPVDGLEGGGLPIEPCKTETELEEAETEPQETSLTPLEISPVVTASGATDATAADTNAAVAADTGNHVVSIIRPLYDGTMIFQAIRDKAGPESFSWEVQVEPDQELKAIDNQHAVVYYEGGHPAFGISAVPAHDAIGTSVPTKLGVSGGKYVTLTVEHHAASFIYPVIGGAGWEGGFQTYMVEMPPPEPIPGEEEEEDESEVGLSEEGLRVGVVTLGPPVASASSVPPGAASPTSIQPKARAYNFDECGWSTAAVPDPGVIKSPVFKRQVSQQCHGHISGPVGEQGSISWAMSMSGVFHYKYGHWVWTNEGPNCREWGPNRPAEVHCYIPGPNPSSERLNVVGDFRFRPGVFAPNGRSVCYVMNGVVPVRPGNPIPGEPVFHGVIHNPHVYEWPGDPCPWGHFPSNALGN